MTTTAALRQHSSNSEADNGRSGADGGGGCNGSCVAVVGDIGDSGWHWGFDFASNTATNQPHMPLWYEIA